MSTQLHVFMQLPLLSSNVWKYLQNPLTGTKKIKIYIYRHHDILLSNAFDVWLLRAALDMQPQQFKELKSQELNCIKKYYMDIPSQDFSFPNSICSSSPLKLNKLN